MITFCNIIMFVQFILNVKDKIIEFRIMGYCKGLEIEENDEIWNIVKIQKLEELGEYIECLLESYRNLRI